MNETRTREEIITKRPPYSKGNFLVVQLMFDAYIYTTQVGTSTGLGSAQILHPIVVVVSRLTHSRR